MVTIPEAFANYREDKTAERERYCSTPLHTSMSFRNGTCLTAAGVSFVLGSTEYSTYMHAVQRRGAPPEKTIAQGKARYYQMHGKIIFTKRSTIFSLDGNVLLFGRITSFHAAAVTTSAVCTTTRYDKPRTR